VSYTLYSYLDCNIIEDPTVIALKYLCDTKNSNICLGIPIVIITHEPWTIFAQTTVSSDIINKIQLQTIRFYIGFIF